VDSALYLLRTANEFRKAALSVNPSSDGRTAVIVDPHPLWLDAVEQILTRTGVQLVGKTTSTAKALAVVENTQPDLLITETTSPDSESFDGLACLQQALERVPHLRAIVLSVNDGQLSVEAALRAGASAYVVKTAHPDDLASAIRQAFDHSMYLWNGYKEPAASLPAMNGNGHDSPDLTRRELEILQLVAEGHSNAQLAGMLWVTEQTIKFHLSNIYRKLEVANRTEASRWAQVNGLLTATSATAAAVSAA
jgi:DNA-binding NarL/FixJ family response regulator